MTAISVMTPPRVLALALAAAALALVSLLLWTLIPAPILSRQAKIAELRAEILMLDKQRARLGDLERWTAARDRALGARSTFVLKNEGASAPAMVQALLRKAADDSGLSVLSAQDFTADDGAGKTAGIRMNVAGDLNALTDFLLALSASSPRFVVEELTVRNQTAGEAGGALNVTVAVSALYWVEAAS